MCPRACVSSSRTGVASAAVDPCAGGSTSSGSIMRPGAMSGRRSWQATPRHAIATKSEDRSSAHESSLRYLCGAWAIDNRLRLLFELRGELAQLIEGVPDGGQGAPEVLGREARMFQRSARRPVVAGRSDALIAACASSMNLSELRY
jgi:hypothetical protein